MQVSALAMRALCVQQAAVLLLELCVLRASASAEITHAPTAAEHSGAEHEKETTSAPTSPEYGITFPLNSWQLAVTIAVPLLCCAFSVILTLVYIRSAVIEASQIVYHSDDTDSNSVTHALKRDASEFVDHVLSSAGIQLTVRGGGRSTSRLSEGLDLDDDGDDAPAWSEPDGLAAG